MQRTGSEARRFRGPAFIAGQVAVALLFGSAGSGIATLREMTAAAADEPAAKKFEVERVTKTARPIGGGLSTTFYAPSEIESPYYKRLAEDEIATGGLAGPYDIAQRHDKFVGWFGVVREIKEDAERNATTLLVEQKYFDGLTDSHIMSLSFDGSGDFLAVLPGTGHKIPRLSLVKVYGTAKKGAGTADDAPALSVAAEFVRIWDWGKFTFMFAEEKQAGNPKWRKLNQVKLDDIYDPFPDVEYYEQRLGKR